METSKRKLTVVVPFLNEEENIPHLYDRLCKVMETQPEALGMLFVDDGSTDGSVRWLAEKAKTDSRVSLLRLSRNFGHQIAITAGLDHADGDAAVIMDADLQDPPEAIPELLAAWRAGSDVVYAVRRSRAGESWAKKFLAAAFYRVFHALAKIDVPMDTGDFRLVDRKVIEALKEVRELHRFMRGLTCWVGFSQSAIYYDRSARHAGETKYPVWKSAKLAWDALTSFSASPLKWMTGAGVVVAVAGIAHTLYLVVSKIRDPERMVPGWATVECSILIVGGIQLLCLGLLGQYISRIFEEIKGRPLYFVREKLGFPGR